MIKYIKYALLVATLSSGLTGCASSQDIDVLKKAQYEQAQENKKIQAEQLDKIEQLEAQQLKWQAIQPSVNRLVAIEKELNTLIAQLNSAVTAQKVEKAKQQKKAQQEKKLAAKKAKASPAVKAPVVNKNMANTNANYALQLMTLSDVKSIEKSWLAIQAKHGNLLADYQPLIETVEVNNKSFYRIKAGAFSAKSEAQKVCSQLEKQKASCLVSAYSGKGLSQFKAENSL